MLFKSIISVVSVCLAITSMNASAIPINIINNGGYTTDTTADLDWLDFRYTSGISYNNAEASASLIEGGGWRYATNAQVEGLFNQFFTSPVYNADGFQLIDNSSEVSDFRRLFGSSCFTCLAGSSFPKFSYGMYLDETDLLRMAGVRDSTSSLLPEDHIFGMDYVELYDPDTSYLNNGTFLVRDASSVPEPSIAILMASGLIAFGVVRRRSRT